MQNGNLIIFMLENVFSHKVIMPKPVLNLRLDTLEKRSKKTTGQNIRSFARYFKFSYLSFAYNVYNAELT